MGDEQTDAPASPRVRAGVGRLLGLAVHMLRASAAWVREPDGTVRYRAGSAGEFPGSPQSFDHLCARVAETGEPLQGSAILEVGGLGEGSFLGVPAQFECTSDRSVVAVIARGGRQWDDADIEQLSALASAIAAEREAAVLRDAQRRAETGLYRSEVLYRQLVETASDLIYRADRLGFVTYVNPAAARVTEYSEDELIGMHFREIVRDDYRDRISDLYADQIARALPTTYFELPLLAKSGEELWIGQNVQLLYDRDEVVGIQAVARDITQQHQVENALRESEKRFRNVVENLGEGLAITNLDDTILYANSRMEALTGYTVDELLGRVAHEALFPPEEWERARAELRRRIDGISGSYEIQHIRKDGTKAWLEVNAVPYRDSDGQIVGTLALIEDVGDRHLAQQALRESEERYRLMVEGSEQVFFYVHDKEHRFEYLSPSVKAVLGYEPEELVGRGYEVLLTGHSSDSVVHYRTDAALESGKGFASYIVLTAHKDGRTVPIELMETPIVRDGAVIGMQGFARDITERQRSKEALERSEEYFRSLTENALDVIHVINADRTTRYVTPSIERLLGYDPESLIGRSIEELIHEEDLQRVIEVLEWMPESSASERIEFRMRHRDGGVRTFEGVARNLLADSAVAGMVLNSRDVTERKQAETEIVRLAALSRESPNPVLECDENGTPVHVNPAAERISAHLGLEGIEEMLPENHAQLISASLDASHGFQSVEVVVGERIFAWTYRPVPEQRVVYLFAVDITTRRHMEEQLRHEALHDALTGLPNRLLFMERLAHAILRAKRRNPYQFAVLFLDLDRFKVVNDSLGHHVGDELLVMVATRLQDCLREEDTVARLGGDEFAILLEDIDGVQDATRIAERIQAALARPVALSGFDMFTSASIGIALNSTAYERPEYLLRNADMAMYRAKASGQARFEVFDRAMHAQALTRLQLETDLRRAVDREEFGVHYQPIICLQTGRLDGLEALVRWDHPDRGLMSPDQFVPVAEETGVILAMGEWVLRTACTQVKRWQDRFAPDHPLQVGVNLSAKQFTQPDLVEQIAEALARSGLPPSQLRLEITESAIMENAETATALLGRLKSLGVQLSLDDFGTGYSSLSYLHKFPLDSLKIDRSFVLRMHEDERSAQLVQTIIGLAKSLGVYAVAEGIEAEEQLERLRAFDCRFGQGYLFSHPLNPDDVERALTRGCDWYPLAV